MIHVALRLERRRRCLAMLVPRVAAYRDVEKTRRRAEPNDPRMVLGFAHVCSLVLWVHIRKGLHKHGSYFLTVAPDRQNKPPRSVEPLRSFSPLTKWQPCCRQPGSPVAFSGRGGTGEDSGSALFPPLHRGGLALVMVRYPASLR